MTQDKKAILLRPIDTCDYEFVYNGYVAQSDFHVLTTGFESGSSKSDAIDYVDRAIVERKEGRAYRFGIWHQDNNMIGVIELHKINWIHRRCEIGIQIWDKGIRGKGFGAQALNILLDIAFKRLNLWRVSAIVTSTNKASLRLFLSAGFIKEGELKEYVYVDGQYLNAVMLSMINHDYEGKI